MNKTCTCRKAGLPCTEICKSCKGENCSNTKISKHQLIENKITFDSSRHEQQIEENNLEVDDDFSLTDQDLYNLIKTNDTIDYGFDTA